ncbi:MAG TPA: magnesium/cobalt transporter CorA [Acidimicrobiales bacterium]|nr:magnesium/cobalt transporter CorA [Acidimicrobiales bacterium]
MPTEVRTYGDGLLTWVDVVDPAAGELEELAGRYDLHPLALEDVAKHGQRPKLEQYPGHAFVVVYSAGLQEVDLFVGDGWLLSVRERDDAGQVWDDEVARARFERLVGAEATVGFLLYVLLDEVVDGYFTCADDAESMLEDVEELIFGPPPPPGQLSPQEQLFAIRRRLVAYRRLLVPLRDVVAALLRGEVAAVDERAQVHLQDVHDHVLRVVDQLDAHRELVASAVDANLAMVSNRLNQVMKRMTSWGAILLGSTLVAGIYGMNFEHMPELEWRYGYLLALGLMALVTLTGYRFFKRKDWL